MANSAKRKGDRAELEVQGLLRELLGVPARRALGAGRKDDVGDIHGVPDTVIQVADWPSDTLRAVREKPRETERQREREDHVCTCGGKEAGHINFDRSLCACNAMHYYCDDCGFQCEPCDDTRTFAATFIRLRGGDYRVVLTPEQWAAYWREAVR